MWSKHFYLTLLEATVNFVFVVYNNVVVAVDAIVVILTLLIIVIVAVPIIVSCGQ